MFECDDITNSSISNFLKFVFQDESINSVLFTLKALAVCRKISLNPFSTNLHRQRSQVATDCRYRHKINDVQQDYCFVEYPNI